MTNYLDPILNNKVTKFAQKKAEKFKGKPKSVKQMLDEIDRIREAKKDFRETFYSSRERNPDDQ